MWNSACICELRKSYVIQKIFKRVDLSAYFVEQIAYFFVFLKVSY